jgi:hypothetical protein
MSGAGFPLQIGEPTEELYGTCSVCGRTARWWNDKLAARWVHVQPMAVTGPNAHRAVVAIPSDTEHKDAS